MSLRSRSAHLALVLAVATSTSCVPERGKPSTGLIVVVQSDLRAMQELGRVVLEARRHDGQHSLASVMVVNEPAQGREPLPFSFAVYARTHDLGEKVELHVSGYAPGGLDLVVRRSARVGFRKDKLLRLVLPLPRACQTRFRPCETKAKTCGPDGECVPLAVDADELEEVTPGEELEGLIELPPAMNMAADNDSGAPPRTRLKSAPPGWALFPRDAGRDAEVDASQPLPTGCETGETYCEGLTLRSCEDGDAWQSTSCFNACVEARPSESDASAAEVGPNAMCTPCTEGETRCGQRDVLTCGTEGEALVTRCYLACDESDESSVMCTPCTEGETRCGQRDVLTCGADGEALVRRCYLGCDETITTCLEQTTHGAALIMTALE